MCGKFTAKADWAEIVAFSQLTATGNDSESVTFRVMSSLPVLVWDKAQKRRRVVAMRWGFPHPADWRRPQPIHARAETIDTMQAFAAAFRAGQRGIVLASTFNEAPDLGDQGSGPQHVITPGDETALGMAFVWRRFDLPGIPAPLLAAVMVTVPANALIAALPTDRMPALLAPEDWDAWLGDPPATPEAARACLKTVEGVRWSLRPEERAARATRRRPTQSDPGGLF
jgi:putative SOS response-associated peptidase YedK